jgi:hypothetical protein
MKEEEIYHSVDSSINNSSSEALIPGPPVVKTPIIAKATEVTKLETPLP